MKLSIIVPVYNEENNIAQVLNLLGKVDYGVDYEIVVVNDGSTDGTYTELQKAKKHVKNIKIISYKKNRGKGYASRLGLKNILGDIVIFQDADLEYNPNQIPSIIKPIIDGEAKVVYGSRFKGKIQNMSFVQYLGNKLLTHATNFLFGSRLSDMECCYTAMHKDAMTKLDLTCDGFEIQAQLTGQLLKSGFGIKEVKVDYKGRTHEEGKKIGVLDGIRTLLTLLKVRLGLM